MGRRRQVRIAHAHVDDVGPGVPRGRLGLVDLLEHVRRQTADAIKIFHGTLAPTTGRTESGEPSRLSKPEPGFGQKSLSINDLERIQARDPLSSGPAMRLNWVLFTTGARQRQFLWRFQPRSGPGPAAAALRQDSASRQRVKTTAFSLLGRLCRGRGRRLAVSGGRQF